MDRPLKYESLEKASRKQLEQMTGDKDVSKWISTHLKRDDLATWFARSYKKDPSIFSDENKMHLEHLGSVADQHEELKNLRLTKGHDFESGLNELKDANSKAEEKIRNNVSIMEPEGEKIIDSDNGYAWYSLGRGSCSKEGAAMGHCGNGPSETPGDDVLSLRKEKKIGKNTYHEPHLTFINNGGVLGEMKGKGNAKPSEKYHEHIKKLLASDHVDHVVGGGYEEEKNFSLDDLPEKDRKELLSKKPDLDPFSQKKSYDIHQFGEKHEEEIDNHNRQIEAANEALSRHGSVDKIFSSNDPSDKDAKLAILNNRAYHNDNNSDHVSTILNGNEDRDVRAAAVNSKHFSPQHMEQALNDKDEFVRQAAVKSEHFSPEHMDQALNDKDEYVRRVAVKSKYFSPQHMEQALNDESKYVRAAAVNSKHFNSEHMEQAFNDESERVRAAAVNSKHFSPEHFDQAFNDKDGYVRAAAVRSEHFSPEHIGQALNDKDEYVRRVAVSSKHFSPEHIGQTLNNKDRDVREAAVNSKHFSPQHIGQVLNDKDEYVRRAAVRSEHFSPQHMEQALNDKDEYVREAAVRSEHFSPQHMEQALNDDSKHVRFAAVNSKHFSPQHIGQVLNDKDEYVRRAAVRSEHFSPQHMEQALNDKDQYVRQAAAESKHFGPQHMEQALNDEDEFVRQAAVRSKHFGPQHMEQALNDKSERVRFAASNSKHFGPEHMEQALNDKDGYVRQAAVRSKHFGPQHMEQALNDKDKFVRQAAAQYKSNASLDKALTAGYGGAGIPTAQTGGSVLQSESLDLACPMCDHNKKTKCKECNKKDKIAKLNKNLQEAVTILKKLNKSSPLDIGRGFKYFTCEGCGHEQIYSKYQTKCRQCQKSLPLEQVKKYLFSV